MLKILRYFQIICVALWLSGLFMTGSMRALMWATPAGYGVGGILALWLIEKRRGTIVAEGSLNPRDKENSPELREAMDNVFKVLAKEGKIPADALKKCEDPHCEGCWDLNHNQNDEGNKV